MSRFSEADAVVYHLRDSIDRQFAESKRRVNQRFIFTLWESPAHTPSLQSYANFFNWTMTYRFNSDIVSSYYFNGPYVHALSSYYRRLIDGNGTRTLRASDYRPSNATLAKKKLGIAAALISNCGGTSRRLEFIHKMQKYIDVQIYGRCGKACPPNVNCRQFIAENYYFILSFENSLCLEYVSK
jgi:hypothetical protein